MRKPNSETEAGGVALFEDCLRRQIRLCQALEALADGLPSCVDTRAATTLMETLHSTLLCCHQMEETVIFPALLNADPELNPTIRRLRGEHFEDQDQTFELMDAVESFVAFQARKDVEEIGYMLRCLFVSLRRHLAFDRDCILPLYRGTGALTPLLRLPQPPER